MKIAFILFFFSSTLIYSQQRNYQLDPTFGNNGMAMVNLNVYETYVQQQVLQPDGKIMVGGCYYASYGSTATRFIIRFNADGTIDNTFAANGRIIIPTTSIFQTDFKIHLFPNGSFLINIPGSEVKKFNADGSLDTGFGTGGIILQSKNCDIVIQNDNKFVVAYSNTYNGQYTRFVVQRYEANGSVDSSFVTTSPDYGVVNYLNSAKLLLQPDGKIVVFHIFQAGGSYTIFRLNPDGSEDSTTVSLPITYATYTFSGLQGDGKLVLKAYNSGIQSKMRRFNTDLTPDSSYGDATGLSPLYPHPGISPINVTKLGVDNTVFTLAEFTDYNSSTKYQKLYQFASNGDTYDVQQLPAALNEKLPINLDTVGYAIYISGHEFLMSTGAHYLNNSIYVAKLKTDGALGIGQNEASKNISFAPNPAVDSVTFNKNIQSALVYSIDGKLMDCRLSGNKLDVTSLVSGVYIIKGVSNEGIIFTQKMIKL